ncbi:DUF192 domain-containing protein [Phaeovulum sp.]|uniref:DUF192 domain-containing protein n=1 Tax=Phaeovulum sp. TaxID=2934796 RepID=UPI0039E6361A
MRAVLAVAAFAIAFGAQAAQAQCRDDLALFRFEGGQARFSVEIADDPGKRAKGLMGRQKLASGAGMLFIYEQPQEVAFWMKNTPLPLDMVFIDQQGRVVRVHDGAVPFDETPIPSGAAVLMVLEINGGLAARIGLKPGAELAHPRIESKIALYPCE